MIVKPIKTDIFQEGDNLFDFINRHCKKISEESVIVITSKIVALSEKRTAIIENARTKEKLIRSESEFVIPTKYAWLAFKDKTVMPSAGIDESNSENKLILLPKDSFKTSSFLRKKLQQKHGLKKLGVLITDSRTLPLRAGITGIALGYAGFRGIKDYRDKPDIFGRKYKVSRTNVADSLSTSAVLVMGEGNEQQPLAIIEKAPIEFCQRVWRKELYIDPKEDMYRPFFSSLPKT